MGTCLYTELQNRHFLRQILAMVEDPIIQLMVGSFQAR